MVDAAEPQRIHHSDRPRTHRQDVADDAADAGGRTLVGLREARVIVALGLERHCPTVTDIDDAGLLTDPR